MDMTSEPNLIVEQPHLDREPGDLVGPCHGADDAWCSAFRPNREVVDAVNRHRGDRRLAVFSGPPRHVRQQIIFIDDSPANVDAAREAGWRAFPFRDAASLHLWPSRSMYGRATQLSTTLELAFRASPTSTSGRADERVL
jgi:hypothetical protein